MVPVLSHSILKSLNFLFSFIILFDKVVIDKQSLSIISGSTVDFKKELIGESFTINNPQASASCGCGLSFSI